MALPVPRPGRTAFGEAFLDGGEGAAVGGDWAQVPNQTTVTKLPVNPKSCHLDF